MLTKEIPLTRGKVAVIDEDMHELISKYKWHYRTDGYAARGETKNKHKKTIFMHNAVLNPPNGTLCDHINGDTLDNRRVNLRIVTKLQNNIHSQRHRNNLSGYKGVGWNKGSNKWEVRIKHHGKVHRVGYYVDKEEAAKAYDKVARLYFGEYAVCNFNTGSKDAVYTAQDVQDLQAENKRLKAELAEYAETFSEQNKALSDHIIKLAAVRAECLKPIMITSDVFGGGVAAGHNILKQAVLAIIKDGDKDA
jgi:hypothetical protein